MQIAENLHAFVWDSMTVNNCSTYLIDAPRPVLVDPGHLRHFDHVEKGLDALGLALEDIGLVICTHAHPDHIEAVRLFRDTSALFALHEVEWRWVTSESAVFRTAVDGDPDRLEPDFLLADGTLTFDNLSLQVIHTPGHSPGSVCLHWPEKGALFTGDLIFDGGIGRTDLPGGDGETIKRSIRNVSGLDARFLLSGHGDVICGEEKVRKNFEDVIGYWFNYV